MLNTQVTFPVDLRLVRNVPFQIGGGFGLGFDDGINVLKYSQAAYGVLDMPRGPG